MKINEAGKMTLNLTETTIETAKQTVMFARENLDTLNMKNEQASEKEQNENDKKSVDPGTFLSRKEKRIYDRLSDKKKKQYIKAAIKKRDAKLYAGIGKKGNITVAVTGNQTVKTGAKTAGQYGIKAASAGTKAAAGAATAGVAVGVEVAAKTGKKTAEVFKGALEAQSIAAEQKIGELRQKLEEKRAENKKNSGTGAGISYAAITVALPILGFVQMAVSVAFGFFGVLIAICAILVAVMIPILGAAVILSSILMQNNGTYGGERIVEVALTQEDNTDGTPYWEYTMGTGFVDGHYTPWCACFVSWCANECGYIDDNIFPKSGSVATYRRYYREKDLLHEEEGYIPKTGDLILFGSDSHIGIVQYVEDERVVTIEGNTTDAVHTRSYSLDNPRITGYCTPEYPGGESIEIPEGMGIYHTYMGWHTITSRTSLQYQLREESGEIYDEEGFVKINGRYVIACTTTFGNVGDYIDFYREDGEVIHAVIGDIKNQNDPGCNEYGHDNGRCVVEYVVSRSWYPSHANPGTAGCHPEWNSRVIKAVNLGTNYFD